MKPLILLLFFGLASCHVHYHIEPKEKPKKVDTTIIKAGEVLTIRGTSRLTDIIVNAATPHTEKEKTIYKSLKDTLK